MTPEARAERERKQKIFVAVGGIVLLALLAFQLPRILGGSSSPEASPTPEATETAPADPGTPTPTGNPTPIVAVGGLRDTDRALPASPGKLRSFRVFDRKDPFVQQVKAPATGAAPGGATGTGSSGTGSTGTPAEGTKGGTAPGETPGTTTPEKGFTVGGSPGAAITVVSVNGKRQTLVPGTAFPSTDPVFVLVAEQPGKKAAVIGIVGGEYANGSRTTKLKVGKPLTLVNTATGARYKVVLVAVGNGSSSPAAPNVTPTAPQPSP